MLENKPPKTRGARRARLLNKQLPPNTRLVKPVFARSDKNCLRASVDFPGASHGVPKLTETTVAILSMGRRSQRYREVSLPGRVRRSRLPGLVEKAAVLPRLERLGD